MLAVLPFDLRSLARSDGLRLDAGIDTIDASPVFAWWPVKVGFEARIARPLDIRSGESVQSQQAFKLNPGISCVRAVVARPKSPHQRVANQVMITSSNRRSSLIDAIGEQIGILERKVSFIPPDDLRKAVSHVGLENAPRILFIHGFTGSPQTLVPQYMRAVESGFTVEVPLLAGHGTVLEDMVPTCYDDYFADVRRALDRLSPNGEETYVVAISMGGTLALDLALVDPRVTRLVLINPLVLAPAPSFLAMLDQAIAAGIETAPAIGSDIADPDVGEASYDGVPIRAARSLYEAAAALAPKVKDVRIPVLLFNSVTDHVVLPENGDHLENNLPNVKRVILERSFHVATLDFDKEIVNSEMIEFLLA